MISFSQYLNKISQNFINESYKIITNVQSLDEFFNESNEFGLGAQYTAVDDKEIQDYLRKRSANKLSKSERYKMPYIHKSNVKIVDEENNLYDTEALKTLIKQRPIKLLKQNEKVSHSGGLNTQYYNIGLPALRALAINEKTDQFVIVNTCPGAGMCKVFCYARKGGYVQWKNSSLSQTKIVNFLLNDPEGFKNQLIAEISTHKVNKSKKETQVAIRWHDAGDFFSDQYLKLAFDVAKAFPDIQFYAYTKMASVASADKPKNFIINFSSGATPEQETQVDLTSTKHSKVVDTSIFHDLVQRNSENKIEYIPGKINELKQRIADYFKINKKTILTYDEWKIKPKKISLQKIGETVKPGPWNVIVKPGDGDESANSLTVIGTYLLMH
jgi:hypothetical protein